jgi:hypothetical protein
MKTVRPTFCVIFRAEAGVDPIRSLRALLKVCLRHFGLRATMAEEIQEAEMSRYSDKIAHEKEIARDRGLYRVEDLKSAGELTHVIDGLQEDVRMFNRKMDILTFRGTQKQLQMNITNAETLMRLFGDDPANWVGQSITLFLEEYQLGQWGIRIRAAEATAGNGPVPARVTDFGDEIPF